MKIKLILSVSLAMLVVSGLFARKIDCSIFLASGGGVHSSTPSVVDKNGNIFVAGGTREGLRVTKDAYQSSYHGHTEGDATGGDIFFMKLSPDGELLYSTYIGGSGSENYCLQMGIDDCGNVYVGFTTDSKDLPVSANACQKSKKGEDDHYIIKFSNDCRYLASTYLGGSGSDHWTRIAVHKKTVYVVGKTRSVDFPITPGAVQKKYDNSAPPDSSHNWLAGDITLTALSSDLDKIKYSTYLGGKSLDHIRSVSFGLPGKIILCGQTFSDNFPITKDAFQKSLSGTDDGFLTIITRDLSRITYSTFIGGDSTDQVNSVLVTDANHIVLAGQTKSPDFPVTTDALNSNYMGGNADGFILKFNITLNKPVYSSFLGGSKTDWMNYIGIKDNKHYLLVGTSSSKDFPVSKDALFRSINGGMDLVMLEMDNSLKNIVYSTYGGGTKQRIMDPSVSPSHEGGLVITSLCVSPDFPVTMKYAEPDQTWMNCLWKFDLDGN